MSVTPYRHTYTVFDYPEPTVSELPWFLRRGSHDIDRANQTGVGAGKANAVYHHPSGAITLPPVSHDTGRMHERSDGASGQLRLADGSADPMLREVPTFRKRTLTGVVYDGNVLASGDWMFEPAVAAGASWVGTRHAGDVAAYPPPPRPTANTPVNRLWVSTKAQAADTPYTVRFTVPDVLHGATDLLLGIGFGGAAAVDAAGKALAGEHWVDFFGNGIANLWERVSGDWTRRGEVQFAHPSAVANLFCNF